MAQASGSLGTQGLGGRVQGPQGWLVLQGSRGSRVAMLTPILFGLGRGGLTPRTHLGTVR